MEQKLEKVKNFAEIGGICIIGLEDGLHPFRLQVSAVITEPHDVFSH